MRYGISSRIQKYLKMQPAVRISILVTMPCNLDCSYCNNKFVTGKYPDTKFTELTPGQWMQKLDRFPVKYTEVHISGGEPMLYEDLGRLVNGLLLRGKHVVLFSNLTIRRELNILKSNRFRIDGVRHHEQVSYQAFHRNAQFYRNQGHRVTVSAFMPENKYERKIKLETKDDNQCLGMNRFIYMPDGRLFTHVEEWVKGIQE